MMINYHFSFKLQILISILIGWLLCGILTAADALSNNKDDLEYMARTDARTDIISQASWFYFPYPGCITWHLLLIYREY